MCEDPLDESNPSEEKIVNLLSGFQPKPGESFYRRMSFAPWSRKDRQSFVVNRQSMRLIRLAVFTIITVLIILLPMLLKPSSITNARQMLRFFWVSDNKSRTIALTYTPTSTSEALLPEPSFPLSLVDASAIAGFQIKTPSSLPDGVTLEGAAYDQTRQAVLIKYAGEGKVILLTQRDYKRVNEYASIGPEASAELVTVRGVQGEYIPGGWVVQTQITPQPGEEYQTIDLVWENQAGMATIRWEENGILYEIVVTSPQNFSRAEILVIAESMR